MSCASQLVKPEWSRSSMLYVIEVPCLLLYSDVTDFIRARKKWLLDWTQMQVAVIRCSQFVGFLQHFGIVFWY